MFDNERPPRSAWLVGTDRALDLVETPIDFGRKSKAKQGLILKHYLFIRRSQVFV